MALLRKDPGSPREIDKMVARAAKLANMTLGPWLQPGEQVAATYPTPESYGTATHGRIHITTRAVLDGRFSPPVRWDIDLLRAVTALSGHVRLGFAEEEDSELVTLTFHLPGTPYLFAHFYGHLAASWAVHCGQEFPHQQMQNNPRLPEIEFEPNEQPVEPPPSSPAETRRPAPKRRR